MGKAKPAVIARALASSAMPLAGRARILHRFVKLVISEATYTAPGHGRARPEQKHTPAKASYAGPFQAAASHSAIWAAACLLFPPSRATISFVVILETQELFLKAHFTHKPIYVCLPLGIARTLGFGPILLRLLLLLLSLY